MRWLGFWWLAGCGGMGEGTDCASSEECPDGEECVGPDDEPVACGIPPREDCEDDAGCGTGAVCSALADPCSPDGVGSECRSACSPTVCGDGFTCDAGGACLPVSCVDDPGRCAVHEVCSPPDPSVPVHARTDGCVSVSCEGDGDCGDAFVCVAGSCQTGLGTCVEPMLVP